MEISRLGVTALPHNVPVQPKARLFCITSYFVKRSSFSLKMEIIWQASNSSRYYLEHSMQVHTIFITLTHTVSYLHIHIHVRLIKQIGTSLSLIRSHKHRISLYLLPNIQANTHSRLLALELKLPSLSHTLSLSLFHSRLFIAPLSPVSISSRPKTNFFALRGGHSASRNTHANWTTIHMTCYRYLLQS